MDRKNIFKIIILIILLAIFAVAGLVFYGKKEKANVNPNIAMRAQDISETDVTVDFNKQIFYDAVSKHTAQSEGKGANFAGGIISHHDLASDMIAEFFAKLSTDKKIKTFILVGPNHANVGLSPVISGRVRWQSPLGTVDTDNEILDRIKESGLISLDEENLEKDHAVKTLVPFIKEYFPDAKIVPLLFTSEETMRKDMLLADKLNSLSSDSTFILASLDFSHYLSAAVADEKDKETLDDIQKKDYAAISAFNSDHTDSHWALITLIRTMELENANGPEVIRHMNSAEFPGEDPTYTTSYFSIVYGH